MANLSGKYKLVTSDKFEEYLKAIGVPEELIELGSDSNAETGVIQDGDNYVISVIAGGHTIDSKFQLGQEFDETLPHGAQVKTLVTREGNKLVQTQKGAFESVITREFNGGELLVTLKAGSVVSTRKYQKVG